VRIAIAADTTAPTFDVHGENDAQIRGKEPEDSFRRRRHARASFFFAREVWTIPGRIAFVRENAAKFIVVRHSSLCAGL
jgi:hypothetical protein